MKVSTRPCAGGSSGDSRTCFWCDIRGHTIRECRKKKEHDKMKPSGSNSKTTSARAAEVEADMATVGFAPWDDPKEVTVSETNLSSDPSISVFDTGATHNVFND